MKAPYESALYEQMTLPSFEAPLATMKLVQALAYAVMAIMAVSSPIFLIIVLLLCYIVMTLFDDYRLNK